MTTPLIPPPPTYYLPATLDGDLVVDFRNRDPNDASAYLDYPDGVEGIFTIYTDLKVAGTERITVTVTPSGYHMVAKVPASQMNTVKDVTLFGFRLAIPDADFTDGTYDKPIVVGYIKRADGKPAP